VCQGIVGDAKLYDLIEKNPDIVVCLDEFSRAHEANRDAFFNAFDGEVQDKKSGKRIKTNRVTFILTTNTGQDALLSSSGVLEKPPRWNSPHNRSLPEVESVIQSGLEEFRRNDPIFKDSSFRARIKEFFMFLPYSFDMRLDILNLLIAKQTRVWGSCFFANGCHCYGCKQSSDKCQCEEKFASKVVFSRRAKLEMLNQLSREAAQKGEYPNTRQLIDGIDKYKTILITSMIDCDVLEGDGFIIDFTGGHWCGKVGMFSTGTLCTLIDDFSH
jgi:hypothetical protein